jgi:AraC family transcriptional regulator, regulatory protein of adaptative response / methylated-DNA-[protein]-cysteine methyltransferase
MHLTQRIKQVLLQQSSVDLFNQTILAKTTTLAVTIAVISIEELNSLHIQYNYYSSPLGNLIIATTHKGVCYVMFIDDEQKAVTDLTNYFPNATLEQASNSPQQQALQVFNGSTSIALKATSFQLMVWQHLLTLPKGTLSSYGAIAQAIHSPKAARAVGTAIGSNPVAVIIPCHRVVQASGALGGYMWGIARKQALLTNELFTS